MVWVGGVDKAELVRAAVGGEDSAEVEWGIGCDEAEAGLRLHVKGDDVREVRAIVDGLLARLGAAEAEFDSVSHA